MGSMYNILWSLSSLIIESVKWEPERNICKHNIFLSYEAILYRKRLYIIKNIVHIHYAVWSIDYHVLFRWHDTILSNRIFFERNLKKIMQIISMHTLLPRFRYNKDI